MVRIKAVSVRSPSPRKGPLERVALDLRAICNRFGAPWTGRKAQMLARAAQTALDEPRALVSYHDCLLFLLAYPEDRDLLQQARAELERVAAAAKALRDRGERARRALDGSGIAWSQSSHAFGYAIARWLAHHRPCHAELEPVEEPGEDAERLKNVLRLALPAMEYELLSERERGVTELLEEAKGASRGSNLQWLVAQIERIRGDDALREHLYETLDLAIRAEPQDGPLSRTFARGLPIRPFFHRRGLQREVDVARLTTKALPPTRRLSLDDARRLIAAARGMLLGLGRETDVISLADPSAVESFDLERGISIALYAMPPERRFPLDSHVGFLLFKNQIPVAYGGGWPFIGTCKIGVNVFEPFRGGESAYLFGQVLRVYAQRFAATRFLVEPYQIGEGNREGIRSGAFWFYYRLGFRPISARHAAEAAAEFERIGTDRAYRTAPAVLRRLSRVDLELPLHGASPANDRWPDPALLSAAVSAWIEREYAGDRIAAQHAAAKRVVRTLGIRDLTSWPSAERHAFASFSLVVALIPDLASWSTRERRDLIAVIRAKGALNEDAFARRSTAHRRLGIELEKIAFAGDAAS